MTTLHPTLSGIYAPIQKDLEAFIETFKKELISKDILIGDIHTHLLKMLGKSLRPALSFLSSKLEGEGNGRVTNLAVAIELIHTATLVHDDIIDVSDLRRNLPSVYFQWGREISIVSGDYLYAKSFMLLSSIEDVWINKVLSQCAYQMCEGEMRQIENRKNFLLTEADYLDIIYQKTAVLFESACKGGAHLSGLSAEKIQKIGCYGRQLGMAFQIADDCLDLIGDTEKMGKVAGDDLEKQDITLPMIYLVQDLTVPEQQSFFQTIEENPSNLLEIIQELAIAKKSIQRAQEKAREYAREAAECLTDFPNSATKSSLMQLTDYCVERLQ